MKIEHTKETFEPITITLETATEFDWLRAVSNISIYRAKEAAEKSAFVIRGTESEIARAQMKLFTALMDINQ